jgi:hypothetical protein
MAERFLVIGIPEEDFYKNKEENERFRLSSDFIADEEATLLIKRLIEEGVFEDGDEIGFSFDIDLNTAPGAVERWAKVFTAFRTPDGDLEPFKHLGDVKFDVVIRRNN